MVATWEIDGLTEFSIFLEVNLVFDVARTLLSC